MPTTKRILDRLLIVACALLAYIIVDVLFVLPFQSKWHHPLFSSLILLVVGFAALITWLLRQYQHFSSDMTPPDHHGWHYTPAARKRVLRGLLIGFAILFCVQLVSTILVTTGTIAQSANETALNKLTTLAGLPMTLSITIAAPITEELIFRGLLINAFLPNRTRRAQVLSICLSSALFTSVHTPTTLIDVLLYFSMGVGLAVTYAYTRDLKCSVGLHILNNVLSTFL